MNRKSREVALCGMLCALAVVTLSCGGLIPMATYCAPLLAMAVLLPVLEEYGPRLAIPAWAAVSILALLLVADRETALVYVFFGWYPVLRPRIARISSPAVRFAVKLVLGNALILTLYGLVLRRWLWGGGLLWYVLAILMGIAYLLVTAAAPTAGTLSNWVTCTIMWTPPGMQATMSMPIS